MCRRGARKGSQPLACPAEPEPWGCHPQCHPQCRLPPLCQLAHLAHLVSTGCGLQTLHLLLLVARGPHEQLRVSSLSDAWLTLLRRITRPSRETSLLQG